LTIITIQYLGYLNMAKKSVDNVKRISLTSRAPFLNIPASALNNSADDSELLVMSDARYLRQSASLIGDALQKGFDVLQMANGDIITTGTKTVVYTYTWDEEKGKLTRAKVRKRAEQPDAEVEEEHEDGEFESL